jgi:hypothetical protein
LETGDLKNPPGEISPKQKEKCMNTVFKKWGAGIFGLLIVTLTAVAGVKTFDLVTILQLGALFASTIVSVGVVGLLPGKWPGAVKTCVDLLGAAIALVLPYAIAHGITWNEVILVLIGVIKAAATELGVNIRTDNIIDATGSGAPTDPAVITSVPAHAGLVADSVAIKAVGGSPMTPSTIVSSQ